MEMRQIKNFHIVNEIKRWNSFVPHVDLVGWTVIPILSSVVNFSIRVFPILVLDLAELDELD